MVGNGFEPARHLPPTHLKTPANPRLDPEFQR